MGIITNGFLIGSKKSAGGINFLKIKGQQVFRNKPQISASYVPSSAQILQRSLQAALTRGIRENAILMDLIEYGWDRHVIKRTNANEFQRDALRLFTREPDSTLSLIGDKEDRMEQAESVGYAEYVMSRMATGDMPLTKSTFEYPNDAITVTGGAITAVPAGVESTKQYLGQKYSQDYVNSEPFSVVVLTSDGTISLEALPFTPTTPANVVSISIAAPAVQNGVIVGYKYSTAQTPSFSEAEPGDPTVSAVSYAGSDVTAAGSFTISAGSQLVLTGTDMTTNGLEVYIEQQSAWMDLIEIGSISASSATSITASFTEIAEGATVSGIRMDGTRVWGTAS